MGHCALFRLSECFFGPLKGLVQYRPFLIYAGHDFRQQSQIAVKSTPDILAHFLAGEQFFLPNAKIQIGLDNLAVDRETHVIAE